MHITIVGLGLIGGSMAIDLRASGFATNIIGVDTNPQHAQQALDLGIVDQIATLDQSISEAQLIILSIPVQHIAGILPTVLDQVSSQVVIDVGSTKVPAVEAIKGHASRAQFVPTHPMAGTEFSGPQAAIPNLFRQKTAIFCDVEHSTASAVELATRLYEDLGMPIIHMESGEHDLHAAYVSHISHISSFALALTVLEKEKDRENIFNLASGGFDSTVRLAKSSKEMWSPIFAQNSENVLNVLDTYMSELRRFKKAITERDLQALDELITEANQIKRIL